VGQSGPNGSPAVASVTIRGIAAGGDGVGRLPDGCTVFVPRTAPGDRATVLVTDRRRRWARAVVQSIDMSGPDRTEPLCVHYGRDQCGGCQLQHLTPEGQRKAKARIVGDALRRIGKFDIPDPDVRPSDSPWRYRAKITLNASRRGGVLGLHSHLDPDAVFEPEDCLITQSSLMAIWSGIRRNRALLPPDVESIVIRATREDEHHVVVKSAHRFDGRALEAAVAVPSVCYWSMHVVTGTLVQESGHVTHSEPLVFDQSHRSMADEIRREAVEWLGPLEGRCAWDLYGGVGDTGRLLATAGATVRSVDADAAAHRWAAGTRPPNGKQLVFVTDRVERVIAVLPEPRVVILNPPRAGIAVEVSAWLDGWGARHRGGRVDYVSCDPATLARDLRRMPRLRLREVRAFDLFPQTSHVETLALLETE